MDESAGATIIGPLFKPFPKYLQLRDVLLRRLERSLQPGDKFPTEQALQAEFGVSRETVREALRGLEEAGLISRTAGRGSYVLRLPGGGREQRLTGMVEDFNDLRMDTVTKALENHLVSAPPAVAQAMETEEGEPVWRISRVRWFEGTPLAVHDAFLPPDLGARVAEVDLSQSSIMAAFGVLSLRSTELHHRIEAIAADAPVAQLLGVMVHAPLLQITRKLRVGRRKQPVLFQSAYRSDRYYYSVALAEAAKARRRDQETNDAR